MNPEGDLADADLTPLARRLAGWTPSAVAAGRDRLLYEAGVAAGRRQAGRRWAAVVLALAVGGGGWTLHEQGVRSRLELALAKRSRALEFPRPVRLLPPQVAPSSPKPLAPTSYLALSRHLDTLGMNAPEPARSVGIDPPFPARLGSILTPISARRPEDLADL